MRHTECTNKWMRELQNEKGEKMGRKSTRVTAKNFSHLRKNANILKILELSRNSKNFNKENWETYTEKHYDQAVKGTDKQFWK